MVLTLLKAPFRILFNNILASFVPRRLLQSVLPRRAIRPWGLLEANRYTTRHQPVRFKSKNKVRRDSAKVVALTDELKQKIKEEEMMQDYAKIVARFQDDLYRKLYLKLTPEILYSIPIPSERVQLGEVATIISQTSVQSPGIQPTSQILVDLSGRPDLAVVVKAAISQFLSEDTELPLSNRSRTNPCSDLIQDVNQTQFTVRLRTFVTGDVRSELTRKGRDMLHRTKKEMDRIYQKFSKSIATMKSLSEDDKRAANEYLKTIVKAQHAAAEKVWKVKEEELLN
ncbi:ribosome recycling factor [Echinococcus multilocularis]|uniref:Ribosome-recycling factor, mitochondrial n=1 Tax=Echinococcus multilocularis TaxID=6211 RepID=A0A087W0J8_ECHMU|nr:ribosome recycling factor [Echinococcus multilocularis]